MLVFCWEILHLYLSVYWPVIFYFLWCIRFWHHGDGGLIEWTLECSFLCIFFFLNSFRRMASLMTQWQRIHLPMQLIWVQSQGQKDPLKKEMTTHQLFSKYLRDFACEIIWSWTFVCWEFINHSFKFSTCDWSVHIFYFFLAQSWEIVIF